VSEERAYTLHVGSDAEGFRVTYVPGRCALQIESWGHWSEDIVAAFSRHVGAAIDKLEKPIQVAWDAGFFSPQSAEGQACLRAIMKRIAEPPGSRVVAQAKNLLTRMQFARLAKDAGLALEFSDVPVSKPPERVR
jgi:hypothetical protein